MRNYIGLGCFIIILLFLSIELAMGQSIPDQQFLNVKAISSDPRLNIPITFDADRMYLGEVLEKVSVQTGVSISISPVDSSSGIPVSCHVKNLPLIDFMTSLWSLVGFSHATWQIISDADHAPPTYYFLPTVSSRGLASRLDLETQENTLKLARLFLQVAGMTPPERQVHIHRVAQTLLLSDDVIAAELMQNIPVMNNFWAQFRMFTTELSAEQLDQVIHGETISLPLSSLNSADQEMMRVFAGHSYSLSNGVRTEVFPDTVRFSFTRYLGAKKHMMSNLCIGVGTGGAFATCDFLASMEFGLALYIYEGWILPSDLRTRDLEKMALKALPAFSEESMWRHTPPFDLLLTQIAYAQDVPYISILPEHPDNGTVVSIGKSFEQCFVDLQTQAGLMHKWRNGVLLYNYPLWFYGDDAQYPYAVVKHLRESKKRRNGTPLTLPDIADAVITLNDPQMKRLAKEFPQVENNKTMRPLFVFYKKYPGILNENGMAADLNMLALLKQLKLISSLAEKDAVQRMRIVEKHSQIADGRRVYRIQFQVNHQEAWQEAGNFSIFPDKSVR